MGDSAFLLRLATALGCMSLPAMASAQGIVISACYNGVDTYTGRPCGDALTPAQRAAQQAKDDQARREQAARDLARKQQVDQQVAIMGPGRRAEAERFVAMREAARLAKAKSAGITSQPQTFVPIGSAADKAGPKGCGFGDGNPGKACAAKVSPQ